MNKLFVVIPPFNPFILVKAKNERMLTMKKIFAILISAVIVCSAFAVTAYANDSEGGVWVDDYFPGEDIPTAEPVDPNEPLIEMDEVAVEEPEPEIPVIASEISGNDTEDGTPEVANPQTGNFSVAIVASIAAMSAAAIVVKRK